MNRRAALLLAALAVFSAAPARIALDPRALVAADPAAGKVLDVPFIPPGEYACGPTSLAMALRWQGLPADPAAINARFMSNAVAGVFTVDLLIAAGDAGADVHLVTGDWDKLRAEIDAGRPPVVFINLQIEPLPARHFALAVGYLRHDNKEYIVLHSGSEAFKMVERRTFERQWGRTKKTMLTLRPQPQATPAGETK
jgi:hypothetical protein